MRRIVLALAAFVAVGVFGCGNNSQRRSSGQAAAVSTGYYTNAMGPIGLRGPPGMYPQAYPGWNVQGGQPPGTQGVGGGGAAGAQAQCPGLDELSQKLDELQKAVDELESGGKE